MQGGCLVQHRWRLGLQASQQQRLRTLDSQGKAEGRSPAPFGTGELHTYSSTAAAAGHIRECFKGAASKCNTSHHRARAIFVQGQNRRHPAALAHCNAALASHSQASSFSMFAHFWPLCIDISSASVLGHCWNMLDDKGCNRMYMLTYWFISPADTLRSDCATRECVLKLHISCCKPICTFQMLLGAFDRRARLLPDSR